MRQCGITLTKVAKDQKEFSALVKGGSQWLLRVFLAGLCPSAEMAQVKGKHIPPFVARLGLLQGFETELLNALQLPDGRDILSHWAANPEALVPERDTSLAMIGSDMFRLGLIPADSPLAQRSSAELDEGIEV